MSFLSAASNDNLLTLDQVLEFLDANTDSESDGSSDAVFPPADETDDLLSAVVRETLDHAEGHPSKPRATATTAPKKKRKRSPASSSTVLQRRKRAEIQALREQVAALQLQVNDLRYSGGNSVPTVLNANTFTDAKTRLQKLSRWHRHAVEQYGVRLESEQVNRRLKGMLLKQRKAVKSLHGVLLSPAVSRVRRLVFFSP
jgi:hypothetical protein